MATGWQVDEFESESGRQPVREFYGKLAGKDRADFAAVVKALAEFGNTLGMPRSKPLGEGLFELRAGRVRIFYVFSGAKTATLLHAYLKQGQKAPLAEIKLARKRQR